MEYEASIIIPTYNEEKGIGKTIRRISPEYEILVVDGGSTDNTVEEAIAAGADQVFEQTGTGKARAMGEGAQFASASIILYMDGDGTHDGRLIPLFVNKLNENPELKMVKSNIETPLLRSIWQDPFNSEIPLSIRIGHAIPYVGMKYIFKAFGIDMRDPLTGMRAYPKSAFLTMMKNKGIYDGFRVEAGIDIFFAQHGWLYAEIEHPYYLREGDSKFLGDVRSFVDIVRMGVDYRLNR